MIAQKNIRLDQKVANVRKTLLDFANAMHLENGAPNPYFQYLVFPSNDEFLLGNRKFKFYFNNYPGSEISIFKSLIMLPTCETLTGYKDWDIQVDFRVDIGGGTHVNGQQVPEHLLGIVLFNTIHDYIMANH